MKQVNSYPKFQTSITCKMHTSCTRIDHQGRVASQSCMLVGTALGTSLPCHKADGEKLMTTDRCTMPQMGSMDAVRYMEVLLEIHGIHVHPSMI